jgi:hypothetical protein
VSLPAVGCCHTVCVLRNIVDVSIRAVRLGFENGTFRIRTRMLLGAFTERGRDKPVHCVKYRPSLVSLKLGTHCNVTANRNTVS